MSLQQSESRRDIKVLCVGIEAVALLAGLHQRIFAQYEWWNEESFQQILAMFGVRASVAYREDEAEGVLPVGFIVSRHVAGEAEILSLGVLPEERRRGIARCLMQDVVQYAKAHQENIFLEVRVSNDAACTLYQEFGFQSSGLRRGYYSDGEDALILSLFY